MAGPREPRPRTRGPGFVLEGAPSFRLELSVSGYQFPSERFGADADWLICWVELRVADRVRVRIDNDPFFEGRNLEVFRDELRELLAERSDDAVLEGVEEMVRLEIVRREGRLALTAAVTNHGDLDVEVDGIDVEAAALKRVEADLGRILAQFPSRYKPAVRRLWTMRARSKLGDFLRRRDC
jgi:hypothetical protein